MQAYLASKNCIHGDLAARNVLVDARKTVKISDFGLCQLIDEGTYAWRGGRLPLKWMAPESLARGVFSTASDVSVPLPLCQSRRYRMPATELTADPCGEK